MSNTRKSVPILAAFALGAAALGTALWLALSPAQRPAEPSAASPSAATAPAPAAEPQGVQPSAPAEPEATATPQFVDTTVVWPVKVELELIRGAHMPAAKDVAPIHTGATARLSGRVQRGELGLAATVTFTAGQNLGRQLVCNDRGEFGATDLWPGLGEVRIEGPNIVSVREVRLRQNYEEQLNISYDLPGEVWGTVYDRENKPLEGVEVELDGLRATTDQSGVFHFAAMTGGDALMLVLKKPGFASHWQRIGVPAGRAIAQGQHKFTLLPGASLELALGARVGGAGDAQIVLLPEQLNLERAYPWHRISPIRMPPGTTRVIEDLPATRVRVRVFHDGAIAEPEQATLALRQGEVTRHQVRLSPAPALNGLVMDRQGRRIENALVTFEAADRTGATQQYLAELDHALEREIIPPLAPAVGEARTNFRGEFLLSSWPKFGKARYLTATSADGTLWGGIVVPAGQKTVELQVAPVSGGTAELSLDFTGRHQGLPVELSVNGEPREPTTVPPNVPLRVSELPTGTWRMRASWNGRSVLAKSFDEFDLTGDLTRVVPLPAGAIVGQDTQTRLRANPATSFAPGDVAAPPRN